MKKIFDIRSDEIRFKEGYWSQALQQNTNALLHQWAMMEQSGTVDNFRIAAGRLQKQRKGYPYTDSDFFKWVEAAARQTAQNKINLNQNDADLTAVLSSKLEESVSLILEAQDEDGYLFTYNQICSSSGRRWKSLLIEHELYCIGHLIEAGVTHFRSTQKQRLIGAARKAAELILREITPYKKRIPGHPEIELALIRLYDVTGNEPYLEGAMKLVQYRNETTRVSAALIRDGIESTRFRLSRKFAPSKYRNLTPPLEMGDRSGKQPKGFGNIRLALKMLSGEYFVTGSRKQKKNEPKGHAVRYLYFRTAEAALISRLTEKGEDLPQWLEERRKPLLEEFDSLIYRYLHPHGGIGDLPGLEGFHPRYAGSAESAYCESCASAAMIPFSMELLRMTREPIYGDLVEWELNNALPATFNSEGNRYYYRQPPVMEPEEQRMEWHPTACCPSNVSRRIASIAETLYREAGNELYILQYASHQIDIERTGTWIEMDSSLPLGNEVNIRIVNRNPRKYRVHLRIPAWAEGYQLYINGRKNSRPEIIMPPFGADWDPHFIYSGFLTIDMDEESESKSIRIVFSDTVRNIEERPAPGQSEWIPSGKRAFYRNSQLYCFDQSVNPQLGKDEFTIDMNTTPEMISLSKVPALSGKKEAPGNSIMLQTTAQEPVYLIPWALHGNYGPGLRTLWLKTRGGIGEWLD